MNADQDTEVLKRLIQGKPLDGLGLGEKNGRVDLSGLLAPEPTVAKRFSTKIADVAVLSGITKITGAKWKSLDFTGSRLNGVLFVDCVISDCIFDECLCQKWGLWSTTVSNTSFCSTDLRNSALGGILEGRRNVFREIDFTKTDLRQTTYTSAEFINCTFKNTRLNKVDFKGSTFKDCSFEGELREVLFYRKGFKGEAFPANEMDGVDFRRAKLRWVEFRGLDLGNVRFPEDNEHVILENYLTVLDRLIQAFGGQTDLASRKLATIFGMKRKWAGLKQQRGILNKNDLLEIGGEDGLRTVLEMIESPRSEL